MAHTITEHSFSVGWLRKWISKTKGWSKAVAIGTDIPQRQVRALRDGQRSYFRDHEMAAFFRFFGARALNDWLREIGFGGAQKLAAKCPHRSLADLNVASAVLSESLADNGKVDHHEIPKINAAFAEAGIAVTFETRAA
jgi:hypothetical protein